ncbi:MAG: acyl transferase [Flavisolibacter sp.]
MHVEIPKATHIEEKVFDINNEKEFNSIALEIYHFQFHNNPIYQEYCLALRKTPDQVQKITDIPFLPISFFKTHRIESGVFDPQLVFKSSGTTGTVTSTHYIKSRELYEKSFTKCFNHFYGTAEDYCVIGLLPSYLERNQSSLVYMVDRLIKKSGHVDSGFYLYDLERLSDTLKRLGRVSQKTILIGVTYALLDLSDRYPQSLEHTIVMETGGMKGRHKEITRQELITQLKNAFDVQSIHSEYGMTELLSQAYGIDGKFKSPPWMKILLRDETDPFSFYPPGFDGAGAINIIDLANLYSCSFIATDDLGRYAEDQTFEVLGRMDHSDIRGCSLMAP